MKIYKNVFLIAIIVSFSIQLFYVFSMQLSLGIVQKVILFFIQMTSIVGYVYFDLFHKNIDEKRKILLKAHQIVFLIYCLNLLYILFIDPDFGRRIMHDTMSFQEYIEYSVNLNLFQSIELFIHGYQIGVVSIETLLRNLLGNFIIFMPMAYFLPILFKKERKLSWFFLTLFCIVLGVEVLQVILRTGSGDIDDLFLNLSGGVVMFIILKWIPLCKIFSEVERE